MRLLSATGAIAPALEKTRAHLLQDFSLRRYMKLASVAFLASLAAGFNFNPNMPSGHSDLHNPISAAVAAVAATALIAIVLAMIVIGLVLFYVGSRMQFVLFETVVMRSSLIAPAWKRYARRTWRWIGLKMMLFLAGFVMMLPVLLPIFLTAIKSERHMGGRAFFVSFLGAFSLMFLLILVLMAIYFLLQDFVMPVMALEDASIGTGLGRLKTLFEQEPGAILLYVLLRFALGIIFSILTFIAWGILIAVSAIPFVIAGFALYLPLHKAGIAGLAVMVAGFLVMGLVAFAWGLCTLIALAGYKETFFQTYAVCFYAGRYPLLNNLFDPQPIAEPLG
jgi:hypothetical protein